MFQKLKPHLKWVVPLAVIVVLAIIFLIGQSPEVISATVSPEVIVKGQNQEVTVTAVVKPRGFIPPIIFVTLSEPKKVEDYNTFKGNSTWLGLLKKSTKDNSGNYIYQRTFTLNHSKAETVQVRLRNLLGLFIYPTVQTDSTTVWPITLPTLRLAVSTRSFSLPQDPGEEGKKTLAGVDSDNDGVRDDIQREIFFAFPESERVRKAFEQTFMAQLSLVIHPTDNKIIYDSVMSSTKGIDCANGVFVTYEQSLRYSQTLDFVEKFVRNTMPRVNAYNISEKFAGTIYNKVNGIMSEKFREPDTYFCEFDWQSLLD